MSLKLLQPFYRKINDLYSQFILSPLSYRAPYFCGICCRIFKGRWSCHIQNHYKAGNALAEQLIGVFFPPGIVLNNKTKDGFCIFCNTPLPNFFSDLIEHLRDSNHQEQVEAYTMKYEVCKFNEIYEACIKDCDDFMKKVMANGIKIVKNGKLKCIGCDFDIPNGKEFCIHITDRFHLDWAVNQLCIAADMIELDRGVTMKNDGFLCLLCKNIIGSGLAGAKEVSDHISTCENVYFEKLMRSSSDEREGSLRLEEYNCDSSAAANCFHNCDIL